MYKSNTTLLDSPTVGRDAAAEADAGLLERWRAGDTQAASQLIDQHYPVVSRFFRNKVDLAAAEDMTQKTFMICVGRRESFRGDASFRAYLLGIARNVLLHELRERSRQPELDGDLISVADIGTSPSQRLARRLEQRLLLQSLRSLPINDQCLLELYRFESMSATEVAEVLGISVTAVRGRLRRAMARLRKRLLVLIDKPNLRESITAEFEPWVRSIREQLDALELPPAAAAPSPRRAESETVPQKAT